MPIRTDLALEAKEMHREDTVLSGVRVRETNHRGITTTVVDVLDQQGVRALHKPVGTYITLEFPHDLLRDPAGFTRTAVRLGRELSRLLPRNGAVLVAGLGNEAVTPDSIGPRTLEHLVVTRHLSASFPQLRPVSALAPGVLGVTGLETQEVLKGLVSRSQPACVVAVDALAARSLHRICTTIQLSNTGIIPGEGVGNRRAALDRRTLGVPVIAVGVPTVVDANTFLEDIAKEAGSDFDKLHKFQAPTLVLTPKDMDAKVARMSKLLGYGISLGLHRGLTVEDITCFVG